MQYVGKVFSTVSQLYKELNPATLSGAIDVVVVEGRDGELCCSPFHVRFGKLQLLRPSDKAVQVIVNDVPADFYMKVGDAGEGFFVLETDAHVPSQFATSPVASPSLSFRNTSDDPDFLDLGGNVNTENDGYVSAPSAHESEDEDEGEGGEPDVSSSPLSPGGGSRSALSLAFTDDMALDIRHRERILHQLDASTLSRPRASSTVTGSTSMMPASEPTPTDLPVMRGPRHRRLLSAVSDSAYILDTFADSREGKAASGAAAAAIAATTDDTGPDGLHTSWDWGVKLMPNIAATPTTPATPVVKAAPPPKPPNVDIPQLVRLAAARLDSPDTKPNALELSLCGADALRTADGLSRHQVFSDAAVGQSAFQADPIGILTNPSLVTRVGGNAYVQGEALVLSLVSHLAFGQPPSESVLSQFSAIDSDILSETVDASHSSVVADTAPTGVSAAQEEVSTGDSAGVTPKPETRRWWRWGQRSVSTQAATTQVSAISATRSVVTSSPALPPPKPDYEADALDLMLSGGDDEEAGVGYMSDDGKLSHPMARRHMHYAKTLRLSSAQLKSLNLRRGANDVKFLVPSNKAYCEARIYLYRYDTQIVISDIDGTITKSDALGHLFNMVGKDWTHPGVAKLYTDIANNGYEILYLTSRAIGQADGTRYFISNVKQSAYKLPSGPLLLSPDRLFTSFHREVIMKRPHEFKMACLRDIRNLFADHSPFYAGFGNRITDAMSYRSVNVPVSRICTIDSYGEIKLDLLPGYKSSYVKINDLVDMMFPALSSKLDPKYNDWEFWRPGLPSIDDDLAEIEAELEREAATNAIALVLAPTSRRLPPNAVAVGVGAPIAAGPHSPAPAPAPAPASSLFTRAARAMSNTGTPHTSSLSSPLVPSSPDLLAMPASVSPLPLPQQPLPLVQQGQSAPLLHSASAANVPMDKVFPPLGSSPPPPIDSFPAAEDDGRGLVPVTSKSSNYSDALDNDSDVDEEDDDDDDDDDLDQDMLAIMHDMDEVQRLQ
ncbi:lipin Ned1 [Coemansia sp. BCRC 34301]|nr:lipin Ned1 [Coemansia sp. BCRC 34301]